MKSWKTTLGGVLLSIGTWASQQSTPWWLYKVGGILAPLGALLLGATARDNNVPSAAIPKAAAAEAVIKGDSKPPFNPA
jgi:hypothetical protein